MIQPKLLLLPLLGALLLTGCSNSSYSSLLKEEKKAIENYIKREHIEITTTLPKDDEWRDNLYYQVPGYDYFYYHLVRRGDSITVKPNGDSIHILPVATTETIVMRYKRYTLTYPSDTISYWNTLDAAYPIEFQYITGNSVCTAWQIAVGYMEYNDSECKIICPSKLGEQESQSTVTAYGYHLHMKVKR